MKRENNDDCCFTTSDQQTTYVCAPVHKPLQLQLNSDNDPSCNQKQEFRPLLTTKPLTLMCQSMAPIVGDANTLCAKKVGPL